jgi:hypothetical protein
MNSASSIKKYKKKANRDTKEVRWQTNFANKLEF